MIEIKQYKKVYITSIYEKTGGPKTLHQLAEFLVNQGVDVYMVYFENVGEFVSKDELLYEINGVKMAPSIIPFWPTTGGGRRRRWPLSGGRGD